MAEHRGSFLILGLALLSFSLAIRIWSGARDLTRQADRACLGRPHLFSLAAV
jgi:hypothetical protein